MTEKILKGILWTGLIISLIQWIKVTIVYMLLYNIDKSKILENLEHYYILMLIVVVCSGFLLVINKTTRK